MLSYLGLCSQAKWYLITLKNNGTMGWNTLGAGSDGKVFTFVGNELAAEYLAAAE